ncbi:MAG: DUF4131 domain-containing protein, partial [Candidatus Nealsonbacteria bacterium]|nr:DUF4131 domain-containing protein [Candidatus Nealsonbacteria bacterium]
MSKSKIFFYFCVSFILGITIRQAVNIYQPRLVSGVVFILGVFLISVFYWNKKAVFVGFCIIFLGIGIWRIDLAIFKNENNDFIKYGLLDRNIDLEAIVIREPQNSEKSLRLTVGSIKIKEGSISGKIIITTGKYPEFKFNDILKVSGKLETPVIL